MLQKVILQNFRSYFQQEFNFHPRFTIIVGPNTAGKTNLVEALLLLSTGKSFRAEKDFQMISFGKDVSHVQALVSFSRVIPAKAGIQQEIDPRLREDDKESNRDRHADARDDEKVKLAIILAQGEATGGRFVKKYLVNDVPKSRNHFVGSLPMVLFRPEELDIIVDGPSLRRSFLDEVLEQTDAQYRSSKLVYDKALRQRNALLDVVKETGIRNAQQFAYWDDLLIEHGSYITNKREEFTTYVTHAAKEVFPFAMYYDKSVMSKERLEQYKDAEVGAGVTLVGPQRDDFYITMKEGEQEQNVQHFGSRGQQRLVILQLKLLQILYTKDKLTQKPILVLDDIFSELDSSHIQLVMDKIQGNQVILTTTHKEFITTHKLKEFDMIELSK